MLFLLCFIIGFSIGNLLHFTVIFGLNLLWFLSDKLPTKQLWIVNLGCLWGFLFSYPKLEKAQWDWLPIVKQTLSQFQIVEKQGVLYQLAVDKPFCTHVKLSAKNKLPNDFLNDQFTGICMGLGNMGKRFDALQLVLQRYLTRWGRVFFWQN